jgi:hypothetical protein
MIKGILNSKFLTLITLPLIFLMVLVSCSKSDDTPAFQAKSKEYKLFNSSSGTAVEAGSFTITEKSDGNARVTVRLNTNYRVSGVVFKSNITITDATNQELVYANLADVDGNTGVGETSLLVASGNNLAVKYTDAISKMGYTVKVFSGANIQARGVIQ